MGCFLRLPLINRMPAYAHSGHSPPSDQILHAPNCRPWNKGQLKSTVRYLGIEVDDALSLSEQVDI